MKNKPLKLFTKEKLEEEFLRFGTFKKVAEEFDCNLSSLCNYANEIGITLHKMPEILKNAEEMKSLYEKHKTLKGIARALNISANAVKTSLDNLNIDFKKNS